MESVSNRNFGIIIAYVIPGFVAMTGPLTHGFFVLRGGHHWVADWLGKDSAEPTIGGVFLAMLVALFCGLVISAIRWLIIDPIHHRTGVNPPRWDFAKLRENIDAYETMVEFHYRYYQFYANSLLAIIYHYVFRLSLLGNDFFVEAFLVVLVCVVLFVSSRDCLSKYYQRVESLLAG